MNTFDFPKCCTGRILAGFGGAGQGQPDKHASVDEIKEYIQAIMHNSGMAFFCCATNNRQTNANVALKNLGFRHSTWMKSRNHPDTRVRLWWKEAQKKDKR